MALDFVLIHILTTLVIGDVYVRADYKTDSAESQVASAMYVFVIIFCIGVWLFVSHNLGDCSEEIFLPAYFIQGHACIGDECIYTLRALVSHHGC
jgi:hypothetical protein